MPAAGADAPPGADPLLAGAPLLAAWDSFVAGAPTPFTIPGHKRRAGTLSAALGRLLAADVPLYGGLDSVRLSGHAVADAEQRAARLWGADWCRFSTGGSTHANQVLVLAVGRPGDTVLVSRAAHRSTLSGLVLAGLRPVWLPAEIDARFGIPAGLRPDAVEAALSAHPDAVAVICVEPSYLGTVSDLPAIVARAHARRIPVLVDQAWGAHFGFHPDYPAHALELGADAMVLSAHKTLPAFSQAALVAARTGLLDPDRLERAVELSATTSPAGAILASIDASRALLAAPLGRSLLGRLAQRVGAARTALADRGVLLPGPGDFAPGRFDPAKLVALLAPSGRSGLRIEQQLLRSSIPVELADRDTVVAIATMLDDDESMTRLVEALTDSMATVDGPPRQLSAGLLWTRPAGTAMTPRDAFFAAHETVPAAAAIGRVSAELIAPYPPGVPVLVPGETITAQAWDALRAGATAGTRIAYASDPTLHRVQVVARQAAAASQLRLAASLPRN